MTKNNDKKKKHSVAFRKKYYNLLMKTRELANECPQRRSSEYGGP